MENKEAERYIELIENVGDQVLNSQMEAEKDVILSLEKGDEKIFVDLGAGYGRVLPVLAKVASEMILIDIDPIMVAESRRRVKKYNQKLEIIEGDITKLSDLLKNKNIKNPVFLLLLNTLGTIKGDYEDVLSGILKIGKMSNGELIVSLFRQESLKGWGMSLYNALEGLVGEPDYDNINFERGIFVSKTGYVSKWWSKKEIWELKKFFGGQVMNEISTPNFCVMHIKI